jgi:hypothetical protein
MDGDLLAQQFIEWILNECATHSLGSFLKDLIQFFDMVTPGNTEELEDGLIIFKS